MYLKEIEYRYNHRKENVFKLFLQLYFGYVSPTENGDHVRVGYQGPELDKYLTDLGFIVVYRTYYGYGWAKFIQKIQDLCLYIPCRSMQLLLCACTVIFYRLTMFMNLLFKKEPAGQITMAIKVSES